MLDDSAARTLACVSLAVRETDARGLLSPGVLFLLDKPSEGCAWEGVTCTGSKVISIKLGGNKLWGKIPPELALMRQAENFRSLLILRIV